MTPERLEECLSIVRWPPATLAEALGCDVSLIHAWLNGLEPVPIKTSAWIETLATTHTAAEKLKPVGIKGKRGRTL